MKELKELARLIAAIAAKLRTLGRESVTCEYRGSGDSGEGYEMEPWTEDASVTVRSVEYAPRARPNRAVHGSRIVYVPESITLAEAIERAADMAIGAAGHDGYENGEGGGGEFILRADGTATLAHFDYVEADSEPHSQHWERPEVGPFDDATATELLEIQAKMRDQGIAHIVVGHSGAGDEGSICNIEAGEMVIDDDIEAALDRATWAVIAAAGLDGYWNGEGGSGDVTFHAGGGVTSEYADYAVEPEYTITQFCVVDRLRRRTSRKDDICMSLRKQELRDIRLANQP